MECVWPDGVVPAQVAGSLTFERRTIREWSAVKNKNMPFRDVPIRKDLLEEMKVWVRSDVRGRTQFHCPLQKGKPIATASLARHQAGGGYRLAHAPIRFVSCVSPAPCKSFPDIMPSCADMYTVNNTRHSGGFPMRL